MSDTSKAIVINFINPEDEIHKKYSYLEDGAFYSYEYETISEFITSAMPDKLYFDMKMLNPLKTFLNPMIKNGKIIFTDQINKFTIGRIHRAEFMTFIDKLMISKDTDYDAKAIACEIYNQLEQLEYESISIEDPPAPAKGGKRRKQKGGALEFLKKVKSLMHKRRGRVYASPTTALSAPITRTKTYSTLDREMEKLYFDMNPIDKKSEYSIDDLPDGIKELVLASYFDDQLNSLLHKFSELDFTNEEQKKKWAMDYCLFTKNLASNENCITFIKNPAVQSGIMNDIVKNLFIKGKEEDPKLINNKADFVSTMKYLLSIVAMLMQTVGSVIDTGILYIYTFKIDSEEHKVMINISAESLEIMLTEATCHKLFGNKERLVENYKPYFNDYTVISKESTGTVHPIYTGWSLNNVNFDIHVSGFFKKNYRLTTDRLQKPEDVDKQIIDMLLTPFDNVTRESIQFINWYRRTLHSIEDKLFDYKHIAECFFRRLFHGENPFKVLRSKSTKKKALIAFLKDIERGIPRLTTSLPMSRGNINIPLGTISEKIYTIKTELNRFAINTVYDHATIDKMFVIMNMIQRAKLRFIMKNTASIDLDPVLEWYHSNHTEFVNKAIDWFNSNPFVTEIPIVSTADGHSFALKCTEAQTVDILLDDIISVLNDNGASEGGSSLYVVFKGRRYKIRTDPKNKRHKYIVTKAYGPLTLSQVRKMDKKKTRGSCKRV